MSDRMQVLRYSTSVYAAQASFEERAKLTRGQSVTRPYTGRLYEQDYTRGSDLSMQTLTETNETLTIQTAKSSPFTIDDLDQVQSNFSLMNTYSTRAMNALEKAVDADYLGEVANASSYIDDGDIGGTAGTAITIDSSNILDIYAATQRKLQLRNIIIIGGLDPRPLAGNMKPGGSSGFGNLSPYVSEKLMLALSADRSTVNGDLVGRNGYEKTYFGFDNYVTTNGYWTGVFSFTATAPVDGDTVTINGVTFTFKTTLGTTAGNVLIGSTANSDAANTNLTALINAPGTTTAQGVALSAANQLLMKRVTATANTSADTCTVAAKGYGYVVTSTTATYGTWSSEVSHNMFGQKGAVDMVLQAKPQVKVSDIPLQIGNYVKPWVLYGKKTFAEGADALVDVRINSSAWV